MSEARGTPALVVAAAAAPAVFASMGLSTLVSPSLFTMVSYLVGGVGWGDTRGMLPVEATLVLVGTPFFHTTDLLTPPWWLYSTEGE